jgi:hypothetical protein
MPNLFSVKFDNTFQEFLKEDAIQSLPTPGNREIGLTSEEEIRILEAMNSVLAGLTQSPALNPYYMVQRIKDRIKLATGLTFDDVFFTSETGPHEKVLVPVDHVPGHTHANLPVVDNGFLNKFPGGLLIRFNFLKSGTIYNIQAEIVKAPTPTPARISEKKD